MIINVVVCHGADVYCIILHSFETKMKFLQDSRWLYYNFNAVLQRIFGVVAFIYLALYGIWLSLESFCFAHILLSLVLQIVILLRLSKVDVSDHYQGVHSKYYATGLNYCYVTTNVQNKGSLKIPFKVYCLKCIK